MSQHLSLQDLQNFDPRPTTGPERDRYCCPFCGGDKPRNKDHQSLSVRTQGERIGCWRCWRCQKAGKLTDYWRERDPSAHQPVRYDKPGLVEGEYPQPPKGLQEQYERMVKAFPASPGEDYLSGRGIPGKVAVLAGCGYTPSWKHYQQDEETRQWQVVGTSRRVVFPVWGREGELIAIQGRKTHDEDYGPKNITRGPTSAGAFAFPGCMDQGWVVAVEGPVNALSLSALKFPALAAMGGSFPVWLMKALRGKVLFIATDHDPVNVHSGKRPGDAAAERWGEMADLAGVPHVRLRPPFEGEDWNDWLKRDWKELRRFLVSAILAE